MKVQENNRVFSNKINVFFNEYNLLMGSGGVTYLPLVSGILSANAKKVYKIKNNFEFFLMWGYNVKLKKSANCPILIGKF